MADDEDMQEHESGSSGMALAYPTEAGNIKKGGLMIMKDTRACKVSRPCPLSAPPPSLPTSGPAEAPLPMPPTTTIPPRTKSACALPSLPVRTTFERCAPAPCHRSPGDHFRAPRHAVMWIAQAK